MKQLKVLAVAATLALSGVAANAVTLVFDYSGTATVNIPDRYADLYDIWNENADFNDFYGTIIVTNFENYAVGTHTLNIATSNSPLSLSLVSGLLTGIEGTRSRTTGTFVPDNSQVGTAGALTITDGVVTGFTWEAVGTTSTALATFNTRTLNGFPVNIESIKVNVGTGIQQTSFGDVVFAQSVRGTAAVNMIDIAPVPEASTYAMMLAGLGVMGFVARRRKQANAA